MSKFTIFIDFDEGTFICQIRASSHNDALEAWLNDPHKSFLMYVKDNFCSSFHRIEKGEDNFSDLVSLEELDQIWCTSGLLFDRLAIIHVIRTL